MWTVVYKSSTAFQFLFMTVVIKSIDGHGLSSKARCELLPNKTKIMPTFPFLSPFNQQYITNKME